MKITLKAAKPESLDLDTLNFFFWEENAEQNCKKLPKEIEKEAREAFIQEEFKGQTDEMVTMSSRGLISAYKIIFTGCGKKEEFDNEMLFEQIAKSFQKSKENKAVKIGLVIPDDWFIKLDTKNTVQAITEAIYLSDYRFLTYKSESEREKTRDVEEVSLVLSPSRIVQAEAGLEFAKITSGANRYSRDLVNEAPQITTPTYLATEAEKIAKNSKGAVTVSILETEQIRKKGMMAFLGVARGSDEPPKFIILKYRPRRPGKKVVIIGKGITFDTGGLSLKPAASMETMKLDMAGAAAVLGIFSALPEIAPSIEVIGYIAACENMPSGRALKPGDILRAVNGKTIEVLNTDAEGRLTLADTLSLAVKEENPDEIIDLATLTGACMVALGEEIAGIFCNNEKLLSSLEKSSNDTGEKIWRLPLEKKYKPLIKSQIADIKNIQTGKYGGAISAALFLEEFVGKTPWAHLDIAGPAFMEKNTQLYTYGATGFGVRLILHYFNSL